MQLTTFRTVSNPDDPAKSELGITCFTSKELAAQYLGTVYQRGHIDPSRFPIRHVPAGEVVVWLRQAKQWASYLTWLMRHREEEAIIHVSVPIADLLLSFEES